MKVMLFLRETLDDKWSLCRAPSICKKNVLDLMRKKYKLKNGFSPSVFLTLDSLGFNYYCCNTSEAAYFYFKYCAPKYFIAYIQIVANNHLVSTQQWYLKSSTRRLNNDHTKISNKLTIFIGSSNLPGLFTR